MPLLLQESKKRSLSLSNVAGAYFILIAGLVLSIIVGVMEFVYTKSKPDRTLSEVGMRVHYIKKTQWQTYDKLCTVKILVHVSEFIYSSHLGY